MSFLTVKMESAKSSEFMVSEVKFDERRFSKERVVTISFLAVAFIFMIVDIVLMAVAASEKEVDKKCASPSPSSHQEGQARSTPTPTTAPSSRCGFSEEAQKAGLAEFLDRVKLTYYKLHPYNVYSDPEVTTDQVIRRLRSYAICDQKPHGHRSGVAERDKQQTNQHIHVEAPGEEGVGTSEALSSACVRPTLRCKLPLRGLDDGAKFVLHAGNLRSRKRCLQWNWTTSQATQRTRCRRH